MSKIIAQIKLITLLIMVNFSFPAFGLQLDEETRNKFPIIEERLQLLLEDLQVNGATSLKWQTLIELGEFGSVENLVSILTPGQGPGFRSADLLRIESIPQDDGILRKARPGKDSLHTCNCGRLGQTFQTSSFEIDQGIFELLTLYPQLSEADQVAVNILFESTFLHELAHIGDNADGKKNSSPRAGTEVGKTFETIVYSQDVSYNNLNSQYVKFYFINNRKYEP